MENNALGINWNVIGPSILFVFFVFATILRISGGGDNSKKKK